MTMKTGFFRKAAGWLALAAGFSAAPAFAASTAADRVVTDALGHEFYLTGADGVLRALLPHTKHSNTVPVPPGAQPPFTSCAQAVITTANGPDRVMLDELGWITPVQDQGGRGSCDTFAATEALESAYLVQYYKMTSDEFTAKHGYPLLLSEQYMITIKNESNLPTHDSGDATTNLQKLAPYCGVMPAYGMPLATTWPYVPTDTEERLMMMPSVPGTPVDTLGFQNFFAQLGVAGAVTQNPNPPPAPPPGEIVLSSTPDLWGLPMQLAVDLASYTWSNLTMPSGPSSTLGPVAALASVQSVYPPQAVHEAALWAPLKVIDVALPRSQNLAVCGNQQMSDIAVNGASKACYEALAAPLEQALSENHAMAIPVNVNAWQYNPTLDAYEYNPSSGQDPLSDDHDVLLVGYDRTKQLFKIKNSWGTSWGSDGGYFYATYDYLLRTIGDAVYVDSVRDPSNGPVPNGIWRGFWQGKLAGVDGVAIIHHMFGIASNQTTTPAGTFYGNDGSQTDINVLDWGLDTGTGTYTGYFGDAGSKPLFSLTMQEGSRNPTASFADVSGKPDGSWSKCQSYNNPDPNVVPFTYQEAAADPYVLPPCDETPPWHVGPSWTCPNGGQYEPQIQYTFTPAGATGSVSTTRNGCLKTTDQAPSCPDGYMLAPDILTVAGGDRTATGGFLTTGVPAPVWQDVCGKAIPILVPGFHLTASDLGCDPSSTDVSKGGCPVPTCAAPKSVFGVSAAVLNLGSNVNGVWAVEGFDLCVSEAYPAVAECPTGYAPSPNGDDCLRYQAPPAPK